MNSTKSILLSSWVFTIDSGSRVFSLAQFYVTIHLIFSCSLFSLYIYIVFYSILFFWWHVIYFGSSPYKVMINIYGTHMMIYLEREKIKVLGWSCWSSRWLPTFMVHLGLVGMGVSLPPCCDP